MHIHAMAGTGWMCVLDTGKLGIMTDEYCMQGGDCMICTEQRRWEVSDVSCVHTVTGYSWCVLHVEDQNFLQLRESDQSCSQSRACWEA